MKLQNDIKIMQLMQKLEECNTQLSGFLNSLDSYQKIEASDFLKMLVRSTMEYNSSFNCLYANGHYFGAAPLGRILMEMCNHLFATILVESKSSFDRLVKLMTENHFNENGVVKSINQEKYKGNALTDAYLVKELAKRFGFEYKVYFWKYNHNIHPSYEHKQFSELKDESVKGEIDKDLVAYSNYFFNLNGMLLANKVMLELLNEFVNKYKA